MNDAPESKGPVGSSQESIALEAMRKRLDERVSAIESILMTIPVMVIEVLLVLSLFVPFVTDEVEGETQTVNLFELLFGLFSPGSDGEVDDSSVVFGVAFAVLVIVIIGSIFTVPILLSRRVSTRAGVTAITFIVLLILGTLGAWTLMAMGLNADSPWVLEPALPLLTVATVLAAMVAFVPAYRSIWEQ